MIQPFLAPYFENKPITHIDASTPGTGKTLLLDVLRRPFSGESLHTISFPKKNGNDKELEKRIVGVLSAGEGSVIFDNVTGKVDSPVIAQLATSLYRGRYLGGNQMFNASVTA